MFTIIMPMFTFGGTFFPIDILPHWALVVAWCLPLTHVAFLTRSAVLGQASPHLWVSALYVAGLSLVLAAWALARMKRRLVP